MKKVISLILSLSIMLSLCGNFGLSVNAADAIPTITVKAVQNSNVVEVTLEIANNPGVYAFNPVIAYDQTAFDVILKDSAPEFELGENFEYETNRIAYASNEDGKLSFVYTTYGASDTSANGALVTFKFAVKLSEPSDCTFEIIYPVDSMGETAAIATNAAGKEVVFGLRSATLSTAAHQHTISENLLTGYVDPNGNENSDMPVGESATYTNGLYIQGAQVRVLTDSEDEVIDNKTGLRFISVVNDDLIQYLKGLDGVTDVGFGTLLVSSKNIGKNEEITIDTNKVTDSYAYKIWKNKTTLGTNFEKYTACVIGIPPEHFTTDIVIRPYITYTCETGMVHYIYGQQYSASLYDFAYAAYIDPNETRDQVKAYLYDSIISQAKGDNDLDDLPF